MNRKKAILAAVVILVILAGAWWLGNPGAPETAPASSDQEATLPIQEEGQEESASAQETETETTPETAEPSSEDGAADQGTSDKSQTKPQTTAPSDQGGKAPAKAETKQSTCTLTIRCDTLVGKPEDLDEAKAELVPASGLLYSATVSFTAGESVFDVLQRAMKEAGIPLEFTSVPVYGSAYFEGIANLYEFDCGPLSGWVYSVNGVFPNYGCSKYTLKDGDQVLWQYTCDLGADVGGDNGAWS